MFSKVSNSFFRIFCMKIEIEHIIGVIIGLTPLIIIAVVFRNNDVMYESSLRHTFSIASLLLTIIGITEKH